MKCQICGVDEAQWAYQPFGPDELPHLHMAYLGSHYRGFPVIKVCPYCCATIKNGTPVEFVHNQKRYIASREEVRAVPEYVADALLWFEMNRRPRDNQ